MAQTTRDPLYRRHRFPAEVIAHAVWLYLRFPLNLRMVEDLLAARGIIVSHQTVRLWAEKFGRHFAKDICRRSAGRFGDKWHLDEVVISIVSKKHWLWRAVDQDGFVLNVLVQSRRNTRAAKRLMRKLLKRQGQKRVHHLAKVRLAWTTDAVLCRRNDVADIVAGFGENENRLALDLRAR